MMLPSALVRSQAAPTFVRRLAAALVYFVFAGFAVAQDAPLKVAVYDPPYGHVEPDGSIDGLNGICGAALRRASDASTISFRSRRWRTSSRVSSGRIMTPQSAP